ncbi:uncharacterized protein BP5553_07262 [Venustampulla echinocandica]|uniref:Ubiquitin-related modifier 1 n=1 Tax=Venustampulla echinocandica TaxID=2656787 RepID=A0A370TIZ5_9HELO|nr:uncharacterized protein BP5553_07262 [Venustampulla echinocandica]RDL35331.1 hypothetical protein BP5553_07262 [Venustampulla echinocandica]
MASEDTISILVEFTGGLEMLFADERKHKLSVPAKDNKGNPVTVGWLVDYLCENVMKDSRKELFVLDDHV